MLPEKINKQLDFHAADCILKFIENNGNSKRPSVIGCNFLIQECPKTFLPVCMKVPAETLLISKSYETVEQNDNEILIDDVKEGAQGSPLQLKVIAKLSEEGEAQEFAAELGEPLPIYTARELMSNLCLTAQKQSTTIDLPLIWFFCDGDDPQHTYALGLKVTSTDDTIFFSTHKIVCKGPVLQEQVPSVFEIAKQDGCRRTEGKVDCSATYDILTALQQDQSVACPQSTLQVHVQWTSTDGLPQTVPTSVGTQTQLNAVVAPGDMRSSAYPVYSDLFILQTFCNGLTEGAVTWVTSQEEGKDSVLQQVRQLMTEMQQGSLQQLHSTDVGKQVEEPLTILNNLVLVKRVDLDFTDKLWDILKFCSSYEELTSCWKEIFSALQSGSLQPMVHKSKQSTLAQCIRHSYFNQMKVPSLRGAGTVTLLIEIGIEKLQHDYINNFVGKELSTAGKMSYYLNTDFSLDERLTRLEKLHCALEFVVLLEQYLDLPHDDLSIAARLALRQLESKPCTENPTFKLPVSARTVLPILSRFEATEWKAEVSATKQSKVTVLLSNVHPFTGRPAAGPQEDITPKEEGDEKSYCYMLVHTQKFQQI